MPWEALTYVFGIGVAVVIVALMVMFVTSLRGVK